MKKISIIGAGAWGTALGQILALRHQVTIWGRNYDKIKSYQETGQHDKLANIPLRENIHWTSDIQQACQDTNIFVLSIPTQHIRSVLDEFKSYIPQAALIIQTAKGIEMNTGMLVHDVTKDVLPENPLYILSGPGFAIDVAQSKPTALSLAGEEKYMKSVQELFVNSSIRPYAHHDVTGVSLGGALKNILAIAAGFCMGYALGEGAKSAIITRGFNEILPPAIQMGAKAQTLYGLSGLGDLMLTANSDLSRNYQFGYMLGQSDDHMENLLSQTTEGYYTLLALEKIIDINSENYPIFNSLMDLITQKKSKQQIIYDLLDRPLREEF